MISILFLSADPSDASRLRLGEEFREIQEKLQLSKSRDEFVLHQRMSVRPSDISQALLDTNPQFVHFSGHGTSAGELCVEDKYGKMHAIQPDALSALFEQFSNQVSCVLLNACYSSKQADAIARHISYVIGMSQTVSDEAAIAFSVGFYQALGAGRSIRDAYKLGCALIRLGNIPEHLTPVLVTKRGPDDSRPRPSSVARNNREDSESSDTTLTPLQGLALGDLNKLRQREKVGQLIDKGEYEMALELEPTNVIAIGELIRKLVRSNLFQDATKLSTRLKESNDSGVGYHVYPQLSLAFEKSGSITQATSIIDELEKAIQTDLTRGYGYLSHSDFLSGILGGIRAVSNEVADASLSSRLRELDAILVSAISALTGNL